MGIIDGFPPYDSKIAVTDDQFSKTYKSPQEWFTRISGALK